MGDERDAFVARYSLWRTAGLCLISIGFVFVCLLGLELFGDSPFERVPTGNERIFLWFVAAFFSWCAVAWARAFFDDRVAICVDRRGIYCRNRRKLIPWSVIRGFDTRVMYVGRGTWLLPNLRYLVFDVHPDFDAEMARSGILSRDWHFGYTGHSDRIDTFSTDKSLEQLVAAIGRYGPERLSKRPD
ncbi:MAG: hypothetical protein AB3N06_03000 [Erythrobacter sp.]